VLGGKTLKGGQSPISFGVTFADLATVLNWDLTPFQLVLALGRFYGVTFLASWSSELFDQELRHELIFIGQNQG
jgi:hypothetical protein